MKELEILDISGFGGPYGGACAQMVIDGILYLVDKPNFDWKGYETHSNIYGICLAKNNDAKSLDKAVTKNVSDCTGAMHQCSIGHLRNIYEHGYQWWIYEGKKRNFKVCKCNVEDDVYDIIFNFKGFDK